MAHIHRVIVGLWLLLLAIASAHATVPKVDGYAVLAAQWPAGRYEPSALLACQAFMTMTTPNRVYVSNTETLCRSYPVGDPGSVGGATISKTTGAACPVNSTPSGGACTCSSGFGESAGQCVPTGQLECAALAGKSVGSKTWKGSGGTFSYCDTFASAGGGHCVVLVAKDIGWPDDSGQEWSMGSGSYTGAYSASCSGNGASSSTPGSGSGESTAGTGDQPNNTAAPAPCPAGQAPGTVNGTTICAPMGSETPTTAPSPDTGTKVETNADGTKKETSTTGTTTCKDSKCTTTNTTTVVTRDAAGNVTGTTTTSTTSSQSQSTFCQANGKSAQCSGEGDGKGGEFSGSCVAGFKATGDDPILNAMALEQHKRNCQLLDTTGSEAQEVAAEMAKTGNQTGSNPNNSEVAVGPSNFDTSDALGGGACNLNKSVTINGFTATLPFNQLCNPLAALGQLLVAVSLLLAARIVTRG